MKKNDYQKKVKKNNRIVYKNIIITIIFLSITIIFIDICFRIIWNINEKENISCIDDDRYTTEARYRRLLSFEGIQTGTQVKAFLMGLKANANQYEQYKLPIIEFIEGIEVKNIIYNNNLSEYQSELDEIYKKIEPRKNYFISLEYSEETHLVNKVIIKQNNK